MSMDLSIIITAGGVGKRMGAGQPKQFLELNGEPILGVTIRRMKEILPDASIIVTLPESSIEAWKEICETKNFAVDHTVLAGGKERFHSVQNALVSVNTKFVFVHDGVRPLFSKELLTGLIHELKNSKAVIPYSKMTESMRRLENSSSTIVNRDEFISIQTPQAFETIALKEAYKTPYNQSFTDDASVMEKAGYPIALIEGNPENLKITKPSDLKLASFLIKELD